MFNWYYLVIIIFGPVGFIISGKPCGDVWRGDIPIIMLERGLAIARFNVAHPY